MGPAQAISHADVICGMKTRRSIVGHGRKPSQSRADLLVRGWPPASLSEVRRKPQNLAGFHRFIAFGSPRRAMPRVWQPVAKLRPIDIRPAARPTYFQNREENPNGEETIRIVSAREAGSARAPNLFGTSPLLNAKMRLWAALQVGRNAQTLLRSIIPIFQRSPKSSSLQFRRLPKKLVAVRLDADVFEWLQQYGAGYSTRISNVLRVVMSQRR
jgi:uncharacterized protein (DUF4415 family)